MDKDPYEVGSASLIAASDGKVNGVSKVTLMHIRNASIAACISATMTLSVVVFTPTNREGYAVMAGRNLIDIVVKIALAFGLYQTKSRIVAITLWLYSFTSLCLMPLFIFVMKFVATKGVAPSLILIFVFFIFYSLGIYGTVDYQATIRETQNKA